MEQVEGLASYSCLLCEYIGRSIRLLLSHLRSIHSSDPHFYVCCGINDCSYTAVSFSALYSHIYRRHSHVISRRTPRVNAAIPNMILSQPIALENLIESSSGEFLTEEYIGESKLISIIIHNLL